MADTIPVLIIRDPDAETEVVVDEEHEGRLDVITIELGSSFSRYLDPDEPESSAGWVLGHMRALDRLRQSGRIYRSVLETVCRASDGFLLGEYLIDEATKLHAAGLRVADSKWLEAIEKMHWPTLCDKHDAYDGVACARVFDEVDGDGWMGLCPAHADAAEREVV